MITIQQLTDEFKLRVFEESYVRIFKCLSLLDEKQLWMSPNENIPSVGNLVLHLCGNARQWILSGLGNKPDNRDRDMEFAAEHKGIRKSDLVFLLQNLKTNINLTFEKIEPENFSHNRRIQAFDVNGVSILTHVIEHFSYHTGQITLLTKLFNNIDTAYYSGLNLNSSNSK